VRRAKLYYLRDRIGKRARVRERRSAGPEIAVERALLYTEEPAQAPEESTSTAPTDEPSATAAPAGESAATGA
jgi:large subunit ribosomal protein L19